jgi:3-oxoacyl-[acyl-carrier-protein] synthase III
MRTSLYIWYSPTKMENIMNIQHAPLSNISLHRELHKVTIASSGIYLPETIVSSDDLLREFDSEAKYGIPINAISDNVGIIEKRVASVDDQPSTLAIRAARQALNEAGCTSIDKLVFCGIMKDQDEPATAHKICHALNLYPRDAYDITDACFGFIRGLQDCVRSIQLGQAESALVLTGEIPSKGGRNFIKQLKDGVDIKTASQLIGFLTAGDAGGAILLRRSGANTVGGFSDFHTEVNSAHWDKCVYHRDSNGDYKGKMMMGHLTAHGRRLGQSLIDRVKSNQGWTPPDHVLSHNTGDGSFECLIASGLAPRERWFKTYKSLGNLMSATFPVNYHLQKQSDAFTSGDRVGCFFNGSGLVFGYFEYVVPKSN